MRTKITDIDLTKLTPYQREVLAALVRRISKNEVMQLLQVVEATTGSAGGISEATMRAVRDHAHAVIEELWSPFPLLRVVGCDSPHAPHPARNG